MAAGILARSAPALLLLACGAGPRAYEERGATDQPVRKGTLVDSHQEGEWTTWYPDGAVESRGSYHADIRDGAWQHWYPNGKLRMAGSYENDRQEGPWQFWFTDGQLQCRGCYRRGREQGEWVFGHEDGSVRQQGCFLDGRRELRWIVRHPGGKPKSEGCYLHDQPVGTWQTWDEAGQQSTTEYRLPDGWRIVRDAWPDGSMRREGFLHDGVPEGPWASYHRAGGLRLCGSFTGGNPTGWWMAQTSDGALFARGEVRNGRPAGSWRVASASGEQVIEPAARPQPPWDHEWSDGAIALQLAPAEVLARWLAEIASSMATPLPPPPTPPPAAPAPAPEPVRLEAPTDPGEFTVREREELERYRRYYRDGFLPRQHSLGGEYGVAESSRRLGQGDRARADALVGRRLPVTKFHTNDGQLLDLEQLRGHKVLLIVLRGFTTQVCVYCFAQTAELVPFVKRFRELDTEVVVVYPGSRSKLDAFLQVCRSEFGEGRPPYRMVYDPDLELSTALGITGNLARPSALVLDREGVVRSAYVAESELNVADRPPAKELIAALEALPR